MIQSEVIGNNVVTLRKSVGIKSRDLAHELDITYNYMSEIERGKRIPSVKLLVAIANYFNVSLSQITEINENNLSKSKITAYHLLNSYPFSDNDLDYLLLMAQRINIYKE